MGDSMTLPVSADLPLASPIDAGKSVGTSDLVELADVTGKWTLLHVQGAAGDWLAQTFGEIPTGPGTVIAMDENIAAWLRPDLFLMVAAPNRTTELSENVPAGLTVTDITHGRGLLQLSGPLSRQVLPKLCGLDFRDSTFLDRHAAPTSYAKVQSVIIRHDKKVNGPPAYYLIIDRSLAAYVWEVTVDAMQEFLEA
jgi:sarcosine oxidase subunit gamma